MYFTTKIPRIGEIDFPPNGDNSINNSFSPFYTLKKHRIRFLPCVLDAGNTGTRFKSTASYSFKVHFSTYCRSKGYSSTFGTVIRSERTLSGGSETVNTPSILKYCQTSPH